MFFKYPDLSHLRVFGFKCWYVVPKSKVQKLDARSKAGIMIGYSSMSKGYKTWDLESSKLIVIRNVTFDESSVDTSEIFLSIGILGNVADPGEKLRKKRPTT